LEIKYSKKKEEMRKDPVMDSLVDAKEWLAHNTSFLMGTVIVLVFISGFFGVYRYMQQSAQMKAADAFGKAMIAYQSQDIPAAGLAFKNVVENYKNTPQAVYSAYMVGYIFLSQQKYDEAINWFKDALSSSNKVAFAGAEPLEALGICYEAKGNMAEAENYYSQALQDKRMAFRYPALKWKLALINKEKHNYTKVSAFCQEIMADTLATKYHRDAENLLTEIRCLAPQG
jgi:tetratricopeptide (TPR) repeat protein